MQPSLAAPLRALEAGMQLGVVGAGAMGSALLRGLLGEGVAPKQLWAATRTPESAAAVAHALGIAASEAYGERVAHSDVIVLAVKPAQVPAALRRLADAGLRPETLVISVAAGIPTRRLEALLAEPNPVVRAMSNTPCLVGEGMTALAAGSRAGEAHLETARRLFAAVGKCIVLEERHLDAVTALSGSGPAYVYLIIEALADAGVRVGLPRDVAMGLVTQTVLGAARMVEKSDRHPAALRDDVTTPAGCTIGALLVLEDGKIRSTLARAVEEAARVLRDLAAASEERRA
ncbi:MAG: pyrroline-5-carboxylate reductase [Vulcanimicrobiaceae bacterium]